VSAGRRFFLYAFLSAILPFLNVSKSQPVTSTRVPSSRVPVNVHSDTPRSPLTKCRALPQFSVDVLTSGRFKHTVVGHHRHECIDIMTVPGLSKGLK
jgi:hypothetical protein